MNGVYRPRGISRVEKLMPGAMTLKARQKPQNRYQKKFGSMVTEAMFSTFRITKMTIMHTAREIQEPLLLPCSPASRNREGSMPPMRPMNRQTDGSGYFSRKNASRLAMPKKPMIPPIKTGISFGTWVLKLAKGWEISSIIGLYTPKMTPSTPPEIPGSTAPRPISAP